MCELHRRTFVHCAKNFDSEIAGVDDSGVADSELKLHSCNFSGPNIPSSSTYYVQFKFNFTACFQRQKKNFRQRRTDDGPTTLASIPVTLTDDLDVQSPANCQDPCTCRVSMPKVDQLPVQNLWRVGKDGQTNGHDRSLYYIGSGGN